MDPDRYHTTKNAIGVTFNSASDPFFETSTPAYVVAGYIVFPGKDNLGGLAKAIKTAGRVTNGTTVGAFRVYDVENALVVAEDTSITNTAKVTGDIGILSNQSDDVSAWEVQVKRISGTGKVQLSSVVIIW